MAKLEIRVGASVDRNMQVAFQPLVEGAKRAKAAIEAESKKSGQAITTGVKKGTKDAEAAFRELEAQVASGMKRSMNAGSAAVVSFASETKKSFSQTKRSFAELAAEAEKSLKKIEQAEKKASEGGSLARRAAGAAYGAAGGNEGVKAGFSRVGRAAYGIAKAGAGAAYNLSKTLASASGVELDPGTIFKKNVDLETLAQNTANSGFIQGDPRNNRRVGKQELMSQALDVGEATGTDANVALEGLNKFVSKTGDLQTGRDLMKEMAIFSKATGSSMEDMMDASGDIANQLDGVENKGQAVKDLMRGFVGQGKLGAVEIKDLASQMSKIGAASTRFEGGQSSIMQMGVLAQAARGRGGSASASSAANAVGSFTALFSKGKRLDAFEKMGVNVEGEKGKIRDPKKIIMDSLLAAQEKAGGQLGNKFNKNLGLMFADVKSRQAIGSFEDKFKSAGGGEAGIKAATEEWDRLEKAIVSNEEIMQSFSRAMKTAESQSEAFNSAIRKSALQMQTDLAPALASLMAAAVPLAKQLAGMVTLATGDKTGGTMKADAETQVGEALASTEKQVADGKISDATIAQSAEAAKAARFSKDRAKAELATAQETLADKKKGYLSANPLGGFGLGSYLWDKTVGTDEKGAADDVEKKKKNLEEANATFDKIVASNEDVKRKLEGKLLVQIANVEELKTAMGAPALDGAGRQPPPEDAPR